MDESERPHGGQDLGKKGKVNAGTNTPSGEGDRSFETIPSSDAPTMVPHSELSASEAPTLVPPSRPVDAASTAAGIATSPGQRPVNTQPGLSEGTTLAGRYQILQTLGEGGMGTVYKAKDLELDRVVALKVIRPDLARDPTIIDRFKQELLLSHRVTHRNVIRIYDLGEGDGVKFITMEFIEGQELRGMIRAHQKLSPEGAAGILIQVCHALDAAHSVGVIHRDLKPQNIMVEPSGRVLMMDFGLARTLEGDGRTQSGALVGTMEYMSPEQALGKTLDQRSDIFSLGLILYEMLSGKLPFRADSLLASLIKRTQERATPVTEHDKTIPEPLSNIVSKCLERELDRRYQNAGELLADLQAWQGKRAGATLSFESGAGPWGRTIPWPWIAAIATVIVVAMSGYLLRDKLRPSFLQSNTGPAVSLAILPFRNSSGDPSIDWLGPSLADMLSTDVGQSAQLRTVSPDRLHQVLQDLHITPSAGVDPAMLRRIAEFTSADVLVFGQYSRFGELVRIDATLQDLKNSREIPLKADASSEKEIPTASDKLADSIRQNLALSKEVLQQLKASAYQPTSSSIEALRDYNLGVALQREGKNLEANKLFAAATKEDPAFALAFSRLAQTYNNLGYDTEAEQSAKKALDLSQNLPEAEKYLLGAVQAQITKNFPAAIKAYENLAKAAPENADVESSLAGLYEQTGDFAKASAYNQKILAANPKDIGATQAMGRLAIKSDNAQAALDPLNRALSLSVQLDNEEQKASTLHAMAVAYRMLDKPDDALRNDQEALAILRKLGQKRGIASSLNEIARTQAQLGNTKDAEANFEEALQIRREIGDKRGLGDTFIDLGNFYDDRGEHDQALRMYKESLQIERDIGNESLQAACLNNIGGVYFARGEYEDARTYYEQALHLREKSNIPEDIVESVHNLAETSARMGEYDQALSLYMRALDLRRSMNDTRGAAIESYTLGMIMDYQGRFGAAVSSKESALKTFQELKDKSYWMAEIEGGYAQALILAGRGDESKKYLDDALSLSRELKNVGMVSQTLVFMGDAAFYGGDSKSAGILYDQALQAANASKEPEKVLVAKLNQAKVAIREGHGQRAIPKLRPLLQQAESLGLKRMVLEVSVSLAEAMMQVHDYSHAESQLERAILQADQLGLKPLSAQSHYLLAGTLRLSGKPVDAQQHARDALQLLDVMRKDPGAEKILQRFDFKTLNEDATRWSQATSN